MLRATRTALVSASLVFAALAVILEVLAWLCLFFLRGDFPFVFFTLLGAAMLFFSIVAAVVAQTRGKGASGRADDVRPRSIAHELLVVVWCILMIGSICAPGFVESKTRSRAGRAKSEMRDLAVCLETYYTDHSAYPPAASSNGVLISPNESGVSASYIPWVLTTPFAYQLSVPLDPFRKSSTYRYATDFEQCWIMASDGPDKDEDMKVAIYPAPQVASGSIELFLRCPGCVEYDPTNGTESSGDVFRTGP